MQQGVSDNGTWRRGAAMATVALAVVVLQLVGVGLAPAGAAADDDERSRFVRALNRSRAALVDAPPLAPAADLDAVAARHAAAMAERGSIFHNPDLNDQVDGWEVVGENVGVGPDVATLHQAFLDSAPHRTNLLDARYAEVGIGLARAGGHLWVVEVFRKPLPAGVTAVGPAPEPAPVVPSAEAVAAVAAVAEPVGADDATVADLTAGWSWSDGSVAAPAAADEPESSRSTIPFRALLALALVGLLLAAGPIVERGPTPRRRPATA